jgi:hypothetical protein
LQALRKKTESIAQNVEEDSKLKEILASYMNAIDHWGRSIAIRAQPEPNPEAAIEQLRIGDNWRTKAGDGFNQFYARKRE